jgi:hypothetical protein
MSPVFSKKINESINRDYKDTYNIRDRSKAAAGRYPQYLNKELRKQGKPSFKEVARAEVGNVVKV